MKLICVNYLAVLGHQPMFMLPLTTSLVWAEALGMSILSTGKMLRELSISSMVLSMTVSSCKLSGPHQDWDPNDNQGPTVPEPDQVASQASDLTAWSAWPLFKLHVFLPLFHL